MILRRTLLGVASAPWLLPFQAAAAETVRSVEVYGTVTAQTNDTITVGTPSGPEIVVRLDADWRAFLGTTIGRNDVLPGSTIGVTAILVGAPVERGTIARNYWVAGPGLAREAARRAVVTFTPPSTRARPRRPETRRIVGTFKELRYGTVMIVDTGRGEFWIKLGPEATGYRVEPGERAAVRSGVPVLINVASGRASGVLVVADGSDPLGGVVTPVR